MVDSFSAVSLAVFQDPSLVSLVVRARSGSESFSPEDAARYGFFLLTVFRRAESAFFHGEQGTLQSDTWYGIRETLDRILTSALARDWWTEAASRFTPAFRAYVDDDLLGKGLGGVADAE